MYNQVYNIELTTEFSHNITQCNIYGMYYVPILTDQI